MNDICAELHALALRGTRHTFPFDASRIPLDGIYVLFENGETGHGGPRIVRAGTHTGKGQLPSRLKQHFLQENKDRSIFRKNVGRALLGKASDPFLSFWELDRTSRKARSLPCTEAELAKQKTIESAVTSYMRASFSFAVLAESDKHTRLLLESRIISTVSRCPVCRPSPNWLGASSPKAKIRESGLWLVNELRKTPLQDDDLQRLKSAFL